SHAGANPELGKNALLAAANCAINLHTLPQFSTGMSRLNVGVLQAGSSRNIVPNKSMLRVETRGDKEEINQMLKEKARYVVEGSAKTFDVDYEIIEVGGAPAYNTYDKELVDLVSGYLENDFNIDIARSLGGSEDVTYMMNKVEENGGKSLHFMFGSDLAAAHHNNKFDFDKNTLPMAFGALSKTIKLLAK